MLKNNAECYTKVLWDKSGYIIMISMKLKTVIKAGQCSLMWMYTYHSYCDQLNMPIFIAKCDNTVYCKINEITAPEHICNSTNDVPTYSVPYSSWRWNITSP